MFYFCALKIVIFLKIQKKPIAAEMNELRFEMVPENFFIFAKMRK